MKFITIRLPVSSKRFSSVMSRKWAGIDFLTTFCPCAPSKYKASRVMTSTTPEQSCSNPIGICTNAALRFSFDLKMKQNKNSHATELTFFAEHKMHFDTLKPF